MLSIQQINTVNIITTYTGELLQSANEADANKFIRDNLKHAMDIRRKKDCKLTVFKDRYNENKSKNNSNLMCNNCIYNKTVPVDNRKSKSTTSNKYTNKKATIKQLKRIKEIEKLLNIKFTGSTVQEAHAFIQSN